VAGLVIAHDDAVARRAWAGLGIVAGASFVTSLDALVLYVAFGAIHRDFPHIGAPAPDARVLIAARVLQGFGAAALTPASLALILRAFPKSRVPQAIALWAAAGALAAALGPTVGGLCVEACAVEQPLSKPESRGAGTRRRLDVPDIQPTRPCLI